MSLRQYLLIMAVMTALCVLALGYVVWTVNPEETNSAGFLLFYLSLFLSLIGLTSIIGFLIRFVFLKRELAVNKVLAAFRQSFLFSGFIAAMLFLQSRSLLSWLNAVILIIGLSALEFFLLNYGRSSVIASPASAGRSNLTDEES
ncbi:MAG: hypothetical protein Q7R92_00630 [bacterium]|nr:hypothetical protein [bacterium]